jgi:hypothetical protein
MAALPPDTIQALAQAHRFFAAGQYAQSASLLENLAKAARATGIPRAPRLFFQAARANWHANQVAHGMDLMHTAVDMFVAAGAIGIASRITTLAMNELNTLDHKQEADQLQQYVSKIPGWGEAAAAASSESKAKPVLPTHCQQCGAVVRPDEVDWIDEITAACGYCGSPMRGEKT